MLDNDARNQQFQNDLRVIASNSIEPIVYQSNHSIVSSGGEYLINRRCQLAVKPKICLFSQLKVFRPWTLDRNRLCRLFYTNQEFPFWMTCHRVTSIRFLSSTIVSRLSYLKFFDWLELFSYSGRNCVREPIHHKNSWQCNEKVLKCNECDSSDCFCF